MISSDCFASVAEFDEWTAERPYAWRQVLAARIALRALPVLSDFYWGSERDRAMRLLPCFWGAELARAMAWHAGHRAMPQLEAQAASLRDDVSRAGAEFAAHASFRFGIALSRCGGVRRQGANRTESFDQAALGAALEGDCR